MELPFLAILCTLKLALTSAVTSALTIDNLQPIWVHFLTLFFFTGTVESIPFLSFLDSSLFVLHVLHMHVYCKQLLILNKPLWEDEKPVFVAPTPVSQKSIFLPYQKTFTNPHYCFCCSLPCLPPYSTFTSPAPALSSLAGKKRQQVSFQVPVSVQGNTTHVLWQPTAACWGVSRSASRLDRWCLSFAFLKVIFRISLSCMLMSFH